MDIDFAQHLCGRLKLSTNAVDTLGDQLQELKVVIPMPVFTRKSETCSRLGCFLVLRRMCQPTMRAQVV
jgi:hypothetical protein